MNDQELINLYNWVKNEDSTYEGRYSFDAFKTKMQDENYSNQLNDWVNKRKTASNKPTEVLKKKVTDESQQRNTMGLPLGGGLSGSNQIKDLAQIGQPQQPQFTQPSVLTAKGKQSYIKPTDFLDSNLIADRMKFALNEQKSQEMINKMKTSSNAQEQADAAVYQEKLNQYKEKLIPEKQKIQKQIIEQARVDSQKNVLTLSNQVNDLISKGVPEDSEEINILKTKIFSEEIKPVNLVKNIFTDEETKELGSSNEDIVAYLEFIKESNPDKYNNLVQKSSSKMLGGISIGNQLTDEQRAKLVNSALEYKSEKVYADYKNLKESGVIDDVNKNFDKYSELSEKSNKIGEYISIYEKRKQDGILTPEDEEKYKVLLEKKQQIDNATKGFSEKLNKVNDVRESMDQKAAEWVKVNLALGGSLDEKQKAIDEADENVKRYPVLGRINEISKFIWNKIIVAPVEGFTDLGTMIGGNIVKAVSDADEKGVERSTNAHREFMSELFDKITFETAESKTLDEKGDVIWSNVPVNTASTLATMAGLFVGGGVVSKVLKNAGAGAKVASKAGSVISSFMLFRNDYYKEYVEAGMKTEDASQYADGAAALTSLLELVSPNDAARSLLTGLNLKKKFVTESAKYFGDKGFNYAMKKGGEFLIKQVGAENVQEMSQAIGDIGVKYIANQNANKEIFNLNMEDFYREAKETVLLTTLTTGIIGGVGVKSEIKQQKKQYTFDAAMNYDAFMQNIESVDITPEEKNKVIESVAEYKKAIDSLPTEMNEDKKRDITPALVRKNKLEAIIKNDGLDDVFKDKAKADLEEVIGVIKKYNEGDKTINIANINDDPSKPLFTTQKAVEEAPVEVAEPLLTAEQTQRKTALEEALNAPENEGKDSFNIGEEIIDRTKAENELDAITQEENKAKIQALYRNKGLEQVAPTTDNGISSTNKSSMDTLKAKIQDVAKVKIIDAAQRAVKTLQSVLPNFDIVVHDDEGSYNAVMADKKGMQGSAGNFSYELNEQGNWTGRIDINLSKANARTVAHEVSHGVMLKVFGDKPALFKNFRDRIASTLKESSNKTLMDFANQYVDKKTGKLLDVTYEEYLAELTGVLAAEEGNLSATTLQKIATLINEIVSKITNGALKPFEDVKDTKQVIDFFSGISKSIRTGASIDEEINGDSEVGTFSITSKSQIKAPKASEDTRDFIKNLVEDIDIREFNGQKFVTNMYDYTNAGVTDLGNEFKINLFGGKNYVPYMMSLQNKKIGDVSNLAAFNSEENALGFIKNAQESKAKLFAPHSGTLSASWQFQQHIFSELVNLVLDKKILTSNELIESFNKTIKGNKEIQKEFSMFSKRYGKDISNFNSFESNPKKIVELLDIVNNYSPNLRKALNNNIATNTKFQEAIGVDNVDSFYNKIIDPLNKGVVGGEIIGVIKFDPSTFKVIKTKPDAIDHHPSFGWTLLAKIDGIYQPTEFHKSIEVTDSYTRYNKGGTNVSVKSDDIKKFSASNVSSSAGSQPKIAEFKVNKQLESSFPLSKSQVVSQLSILQKELKKANAPEKLIKAVPKDTILRETFLTDTKRIADSLLGLAGNFSIKENKIRIGKFYSAIYGGRDKVLIHEAAHAATMFVYVDILTNKGDYTREQVLAARELNDIASEYVKNTSLLAKMTFPRLYGTTNSYEFIAEFISNNNFRKYISENNPSKKRNVSNYIWDSILRMLGIKKSNINQELINKIENGIDTTLEISSNRNKQLESSFPLSKSQVTAWHGSPHNFDKFTTEKIGKGTGAQAFGWGLYFTDVKSIAEYYAKETEGENKLYEVSIFKGKKPDQYSWLDYDNNITEQQKTKILDSFIKERNISNETLEKLKEEEPQNQEPLDALDIFEELGIPNNDGLVIENLLRDNTKGFRIYDLLQNSFKDAKKASLFLLDSGIDGIKYNSNEKKYDSASSGKNYVVFDENAVEITSKSQKADKQMVDFIKDSRAQGVSENDIKNFLIGKGFTAQEVDDIMSVEKGASVKTELSEALLPGYDRLMRIISGVIDKSQNKRVAFNKIMDNAMNYLIGSKVYINATDVQREMLVRDLNKMFGKKEKSAPSVGKILGTIKDITKITLSEAELMKLSIKDLARGAKNANDARTKITQLLSKEIKELKLKGKVTVTQLTNILRRFSKVNMFDENSISNFVDYMTKVFENADYANKIEGVRAKLNQAKKNIRTKIGIADGLYGPLNRLFSINPTMIPDSVLEKYIQIVDMLGERAAVLNLTDKKELIADTMEVLDAIDLQQSVIDDLAYRFENSNNKVFDDNGKLDYQATIQNMIAKGELVLTDVENMNKFKSLIVPKEDKVEMTESEIQAEKYDLISGIDSIVQDIESSNSIDELGTQNERNLAKDLIELVKSKAIDGLTNSQLKNLSKVLENINNGYVSKMTGTMKEDLNAVEDTLLYKESLNKAKLLPFSKLYSKLKSLILKGTTRKSIDEMVRRNPLYFVDQLLGDYKTKNVFNALFDKAAKAEAAYKSDIKRVHNILDKALERVAKSKGLNANQTLISSYKMTTYLVQLEYLSNLGSKQVNKASDYLRETIKFIESEKSQFGERDAKMLQDILDEFEKNGENIDILYNSFNNAEKEAIKEIRDLNDSLKEKAEYTAAIIRGDKISALTNYVHMNVLLESNPSDTQNLSEATDANNNMKPSTKAKSLIERTKGVKPINFNIFSSVERGAKYVLMDFHLTEPIRTARKTINRTLNEMEKDGKIPKEVVKIKNAIDNAFEEVVSNLLNNSIMISSFGDEVVDFLNKNGYRSILAGTGRFANELISNMGFAVIADPKAMATGMSYRNIIMSPDAIKILENVGSKQLARLFHESSLSGRVIDTEILNQAAGIKNSKAKNAVANRIQQIWNLTGKKVPNTVSFIADGLISTPDKLIMRPMWFGSFANQFEKITGEKVDLELIAANDESYMNQYKEAIKESARLADDRSVSAGATDNSFMGILKGAKKPNQKFWVRGFNNFNNFMTKFMIYEYITARTGIMAAMGNGSITRKQGVALLAGVSTRMVTYSTLAHYTGTGLVGLIASGLGYDDDEPEVLEKSFLQTLGQSIVSAGTGLVLGRDFGNATKNIINYGLEKVNENYLDALRVGEYDPYKDAIQYTIVPPDKKGVQTGLFDLVKNLGGASGPVLKTADLLVKNMLAEPKKEAGAIQRQSDERNIRIPLEVLGSLGYIPFYKEVRKQAIKNIYGSIQTEIRDAADKKKQKIEMLQGYKNQTDMKKYDPELYETTFGEGSVGYDEREAVKKLKKAERDLKKQLEDIERGYIKPTKESKSSFGSEGLGEPEKRTRKSKSSFGSAGFGGG